MPKIDTMEQSMFSGYSFKVPTPDGTAYVIISEDTNGKPIAIHINIGKAGSQVAAWAHTASRLCSLALDHGASIRDIIKELEQNTTDKLRVMTNGVKIRSGVEGVCYALIQYMAMKNQEEIRRLGISYDRPRLGVRNSAPKR